MKNIDKYYWYFAEAILIFIMTIILSYKMIFSKSDILYITGLVIWIPIISVCIKLTTIGIKKYKDQGED